jgi:hypothetical protein
MRHARYKWNTVEPFAEKSPCGSIFNGIEALGDENPSPARHVKFPNHWFAMSSCSIDPAISSLLAAQEGATRTQIQFAVAAKQLNLQEQQGAAMNELLEQAAALGKSLAGGQSFDAVA